MKFPRFCYGRALFHCWLVLYAWLRLKGTPAPSPREWGLSFHARSADLLARLRLFVWAEQRVPSGVTAVVLANHSCIYCASGNHLLRTQKLTVRLGMALAVGISGVAVLMNRSFSLARAPKIAPARWPCWLAPQRGRLRRSLLAGFPLPASKAMSCGCPDGLPRSDALLLAAVSHEFAGFRVQAVLPKRLVGSD